MTNPPPSRQPQALTSTVTDPDLSPYAKATDLAALALRVSKLEAAVTPVRPFPAPVTVRTVSLPPSVDVTGVTEMGGPLNAFIANVPDGSTIDFGAAVALWLAQGIQLGGRKNLIFDGRGVTLKGGPGASGADQLTSQFALGKNYGSPGYGTVTDIVIHDFVLIGTSPTPGVYIGGSESQMNLYLTALGTTGARIEVYNITGSAAYGDGVYWDGITDGWLHNCHFPTAGRNGVSVVGGTRIINELSAFDVSGYVTCDFEPSAITEAITNCSFRNNTVGRHADQFFALEGSHTGAPINGVYVTGNTVSGGSLLTTCDNGDTARMRNVVFSGNKGAAGDSISFAHIDGLTVKGNTGAGVALAPIVTDCTAVVLA